MKNKLLLSLLASIGLISVQAQQFSYETTQHTSPLAGVINMSTPSPEYDARLLLIKSAAPVPLNSTRYKKLQLDAQRATFVSGTNTTNQYKTTAASPQIIKGFTANGTQGTPNDNDVAMSNGGFIVSVVNSNINIYSDTGRFVISRTLANFARSLGSLNRTYDPRAIYDPVSDRFIVVFLQGSTSADTRIITGFSKTNDPSKEWNFYAIPGNVFGDSSWSDYPIISLSNNELFITVNRLRDNSSWQEGFIESLIWQVNKQDGFAGDSLRKKVYYNIKYNNKPIWSICPVKGSSELYGPNQYFVSVRPGDLRNDTVFLHEVTNTLDGNPQLTLKVLKTDVPYGLQPNAPQPNGQYLQTNDARVLSAFRHANIIHYTGNTINPTSFSPSVYYGRIDLTNAQSPVIKGQIISYDSMDIGYPAVAYAGGGFWQDQTAMITFSHVSKTKFPGNSVVYIDRDANVSAPVHLRTGDGSINVLGDTIERWGDYTGIQPAYLRPGECVTANSYGIANGQHLTWVARVKSKDPRLGIGQIEGSTVSQMQMYPVPADSYTQVEFDLTQAMMLNFSLITIDGKQHIDLLRDKGKTGTNRFVFSTHDLPEGTYILNISSNEKNILSKRLVVRH